MTALRAPRILLVDDDPELRSLLAKILRADGYEVIQAIDGVQAFDYVGTCIRHVSLDPPDLVIADIRMPRVTGFQLLASIRAATKVAPPLPVILITAFGDPETHAQARRLGAIAVLDKPFELDALRALARQLLHADARA